MMLINKVEQLVYKSATWKYLLAISLLMIFKTGIWCIPNFGAARAVAQNPFENPFSDPYAHYIYWNWLGPFFAWLLGATNWKSFFIFHLFFSILFTILFFRKILVTLPQQEARSSILLFSMLPVSATAYYWVGVDSITLCLIAFAFTFNNSLFVAFLTGVALGMQHFEQASLAFFVLFLALGFSVFSWHKNYPSQHYEGAVVKLLLFSGMVLLGVMLGKLGLRELFNLLDIEVNSGRVFWLKQYYSTLFTQFIYHVHAILWSTLGLAWVVFLKYCEIKPKYPFVLTFFILTLLLPFAADHTRVFSIVSLPLITVFWLLNKNFLASLDKKTLATLALIWAMLPWAWVWSGVSRDSLIPNDIVVLLHSFIGWPTLPDNVDLPLWPFKPE